MLIGGNEGSAMRWHELPRPTNVQLECGRIARIRQSNEFVYVYKEVCHLSQYANALRQYGGNFIGQCIVIILSSNKRSQYRISFRFVRMFLSLPSANAICHYPDVCVCSLFVYRVLSYISRFNA